MVILNVQDAVSYCVGGFGEGLDPPECVSWGCDGYASAGGEGGQLYRIDTNMGSFEEFVNVGTFVGGICQDGNFNIYVCSGGVVKKVDQSGNVSVYSDGTESTKMLTRIILHLIQMEIFMFLIQENGGKIMDVCLRSIVMEKPKFGRRT